MVGGAPAQLSTFDGIPVCCCLRPSPIPMKTRALLAILFLLFSTLGVAAGAAAKPNVIFILADDLGYGDVGAFGQKLIKTPNIDRLAAEGTKFTQAYCGATVCAPSRC